VAGLGGDRLTLPVAARRLRQVPKRRPCRMKMFLFPLCLVMLCAPVCTWAASDGFARYQVILERKPFGEPPPPVEVPVEVPEEEPPWAKAYRLCSVYEANDGGIQVAVLDTKTNKPLMLTLGEEPVQGITLISANVGDEEATLTKDGLQVTMKLETSRRPAPKKRPAKQPARRAVVVPPATAQNAAAAPGSAPRAPARRRVMPTRK